MEGQAMLGSLRGLKFAIADENSSGSYILSLSNSFGNCEHQVIPAVSIGRTLVSID
jgi:hypothetical protein